jgi:hypothetical protein
MVAAGSEDDLAKARRFRCAVTLLKAGGGFLTKNGFG